MYVRVYVFMYSTALPITQDGPKMQGNGYEKEKKKRRKNSRNRPFREIKAEQNEGREVQPYCKYGNLLQKQEL
jgi:hypothetical protein